MSVNVRSQLTASSGAIDPFLYCSKSEGFFDERTSAWHSLGLYQSFDGSFSGDQFCPSSSPSSPASVAATENLNYFHTYDPEETCYVKEEPFEDFYQHDDPYQLLLSEPFAGGLPNLDSLSEDFCNIPHSQDPELEARYLDFIEIFGTESINPSSSQSTYCPAATFSSFMESVTAMDVAESDDGVDSTPSGSISGSQKRTSARLGGSRAKISRAKKATANQLIKHGSKLEEPDFSGVYEKLSHFKSAGTSGDTSRRTSVSRSQSTTTSNSDEDLPSGQHKQTYTRRREKNNIAVRKSREKKRQEIKKFADEHGKLKREVEQIRAQNEKLRNLVTIVEDGIVGEKSKAELEALIKTAKKQLHWC